ncbi:winged helix-turn-helix domain-containing protein [Kitasatospora sp. NPDC001574]
MSDGSSTDALVGILRREVAGLAPGARLPSSRDLIARHGVGPVTVSRAIAQLAAEGLVVTRPGSGTFVAVRRSRPGSQAPDTSWQAVALAGRPQAPGGDPGADPGAEPGAEPGGTDDTSATAPAGTISLAGSFRRQLRRGRKR